jgi:16S rRNA (guanine966-N2)-methyltransferase
MKYPKRGTSTEPAPDTDLRIIGGKLRGSKLWYHGDPVTRPMKHRVREAIFNLVGTEIEGRHAMDLFAGTGALGLEALSRGAATALFIERHIPTARGLRENIERLGAAEQSELLEASAFVWGKRDLPKLSTDTPPWLVFISPPYAFFVDRQADMLELVSALVQYAPDGSTLVVEADERFDVALLPGELKQSRHDSGWDIRTYPPAVVATWRKENVQAN